LLQNAEHWLKTHVGIDDDTQSNYMTEL